MPEICTNVDLSWNDQDRILGRFHLMEYGMVILNESGFPVPNPKEAREKFCNLSNQILGKLSDIHLDYCAELGREISGKRVCSRIMGPSNSEQLGAILHGFLDCMALEKKISGDEKQWLYWYFNQTDRSPEISELKQQRLHRPVKKPARIEIHAGKHTFLVAEENYFTGENSKLRAGGKAMTQFDVVFLEKPGITGLTKTEMMDLFDMLAENEAYPLEIGNPCGDSTAMGVITPAAADRLDYDYDELTKFIQKILGDMERESEDGYYEFKGLRIYLSR